MLRGWIVGIWLTFSLNNFRREKDFDGGSFVVIRVNCFDFRQRKSTVNLKSEMYSQGILWDFGLSVKIQLCGRRFGLSI